MQEIAKRSDVKKLANGVYAKIIKEGKGKIPSESAIVKVNYEGRTIDGKVFDSTYKRKSPISMRPNQTISGWEIILTQMPVGSVWEVYIASDQAYGSDSHVGVPSYSALIFKIELLSIEK